MFLIICAEKGSYDSNIKTKVLAHAKNKEEAVKELIDLLVGDLISQMSDKDYSLYGVDFDMETKEVHDTLSEKISNAFEAKEKRLFYNNNEDYIQLDYNRQKSICGYTIPCSSLNEYQGKTVTMFM